MGVLSTIVSQAQPALYGAGASASATAGATWLWEFVGLVDTSDEPIDLSGVTGTCEIVTKDARTLVAALDFDGDADGSFTIGLDEADTAALTDGQYCWRLTLDDATDVVQVWGGAASKFTIVEA